jgi:hypothetical protein
MTLRQRETRAWCMPYLYQLVYCSRSHVLTARISVSPLPEAVSVWTSIQRCFYRLHNFHTQHTTVCEYSPYFLSPPLRIKLQLVVCNVCQTQTPFSQTTRAALSVGRLFTYANVRNKHQCCYLSIFTLLSLFWNEKKNVWGITFWATYVVYCSDYFSWI